MKKGFYVFIFIVIIIELLAAIVFISRVEHKLNYILPILEDEHKTLSDYCDRCFIGDCAKLKEHEDDISTML